MRSKLGKHPFDYQANVTPTHGHGLEPHSVQFGRGRADGGGHNDKWGDGWGSGRYNDEGTTQYGGPTDSVGYDIARHMRYQGKGVLACPKKAKHKHES
jgi:hypothetical protein